MPDYESISTEIMEMVEVDQAVRRNDPVDWNQVEVIDKRNAARLKEIITEIGWPTISKVGKKASQGAWLIAQHADFDLEFQRSALDMLQAQPKEEVNQNNIALLVDRVMLKEKGVQRYGTQLQSKGDYLVLRPLEDSNRLHELRAEVGLDPIEEYLESFGKPAFVSEEAAQIYLSEKSVKLQ